MSASAHDSPVFPGITLDPPPWSATGRRQAAAWAALARLLRVALAGLVLPALLLGLWWLTAERAWIAPQILPSPAFVWESLCLVVESGELWPHIGRSAQRVAWSLLLGGGAGLALGFGIGLSSTLRAYLLPTLRSLAQVPVLGWIPLLIIFAGIEEPLKLWAVSLAVAVPVMLTTLDGIANIPTALLEVGRVYSFSPLQILRRIIVPATLPNLFSALRQGVMQAWLTVIFVELLSASEGLGFFMAYSRSLGQIDMVIVSMAVIGAVGILIEALLRLIERPLQSWRRAAF